jgi:hypothetical protein
MEINSAFARLYTYAITISLILIGVCIIIKVFEEIGLINLNVLTTINKKFLSIVSPVKQKLNFFKKIKLNNSTKKNLKLFFSISMITLLSRVIIFLLVFIWNYFNQGNPQGFFESFEKLWVKWDSPHYILLAENWYASEGDASRYIVFYPLYPLLMSIFNFFTKNSVISGVIISNICTCFASYYLYKLVDMEFDDKTAFKAVKYMLIFPFSFFFGIVYTESLFIMLSIMCFYYLRKNNWILAGFLGFLSAITKNQGVLLFAAAFVEVLISLNIPNIQYALQNKKRLCINFLKKFVCIIPIPLGFGAYLALNKVVTGSWFKFLEHQSFYWHHNFSLIPNTLKIHFRYIANPSYTGLHRISIWLPQLALLLLAVLLMIYAFKKVRVSYILYMLLYTITIYSTTWLISGGRYMLCLFPIHILFAIMSRKNRYVDFLLTFTSLVFLGLYTFTFYQNGVL